MLHVSLNSSDWIQLFPAATSSQGQYVTNYAYKKCSFTISYLKRSLVSNRKLSNIIIQYISISIVYQFTMHQNMYSYRAFLPVRLGNLLTRPKFFLFLEWSCPKFLCTISIFTAEASFIIKMISSFKHLFFSSFFQKGYF